MTECSLQGASRVDSGKDYEILSNVDLPGGCLNSPAQFQYNAFNMISNNTNECGSDGWTCLCIEKGALASVSHGEQASSSDPLLPKQDVVDDNASEALKLALLLIASLGGLLAAGIAFCRFVRRRQSASTHPQPKAHIKETAQNYNSNLFEEPNSPGSGQHWSPKDGTVSSYPSPNPSGYFPVQTPTLPLGMGGSPELNYLGPSLQSWQSHQAPHQNRPSTPLDNRFSTYVLQKRLSSSGFFSDVYLAMDMETEKPVAVKALSDEWFMSGDFISEINFLTSARHDNLVKFIASFVVQTRELFDRHARGQLQDPNGAWRPDNGTNPIKSFSPDYPRVCIVTEYLDGGSLTDFIARRRAEGKYLEPAELLNFAAQITSVVCYLHCSALSRPIAHGDIKPDNILLSLAEDSDHLVYKLADMGMSFVKNRSRRLETLRYKSALIPKWFENRQLEQADSKPLSADAYAVGACILKLAALDTDGEEEPFNRAAALQQAELQYGANLRRILEKCCSDTWEKQLPSHEMFMLFSQRWSNLVATP